MLISRFVRSTASRVCLVFLFLVLGVLGMPQQRVQAQEGCPEGGCLTYVPVVVLGRVYARVTGAYTYNVMDRGVCYGIAAVTVKNTSDVPITNVRVQGQVRSGEVSYTSSVVIFPSNTWQFVFPLDDCIDQAERATFIVMDALPQPNIRPITVEWAEAVAQECTMVRYVMVQGSIRNDLGYPLTKVKVMLDAGGAHGPALLEVVTLRPGERAGFDTELSTWVDTPPDNPCTALFPVDIAAVVAWGEVAP